MHHIKKTLASFGDYLSSTRSGRLIKEEVISMRKSAEGKPYLSLVCEKEIHEWLKKRSKENYRTVAAEIRLILMQAYRRDVQAAKQAA